MEDDRVDRGALEEVDDDVEQVGQRGEWGCLEFVWGVVYELLCGCFGCVWKLCFICLWVVWGSCLGDVVQVFVSGLFEELFGSCSRLCFGIVLGWLCGGVREIAWCCLLEIVFES